MPAPGAGESQPASNEAPPVAKVVGGLAAMQGYVSVFGLLNILPSHIPPVAPATVEAGMSDAPPTSAADESEPASKEAMPFAKVGGLAEM